MTTINDTYINALLADSSYVLNLKPGQTGVALTGALTGRMTAPISKYIGDNFSVVSQVGNLASSFDATVWRGNAGTAYAGQIYVSMRGTQEIPDFLADGDLAASGLAHAQLVDMVNWWLRETTPTSMKAKQIAISTIVIPGLPIPLQNFVAAADVQGTGTLVGIGPIKSVNGHSLGGYLSSAFVRLFGTQWPVEMINTFNSAGFSRPAILNIENGFSQITSVIGAGLGLGGFSGAQNNYYGQNGINVTTNTWNPIGFQQYGTRVGLFQEDLTSAIIDNHYMYKLTDLLALGNALAQLDPTLDLAKLSALVSAGSNQMVASYEGVLDAFRKLLLGASATTTLAGDSNANNAGPQPAARIEFLTNLATLQADPKFTALQGKVQIVTPPTSATQARTDFGALLSLVYLTPFALKPADAVALAILKSAQTTLAAQWDADQVLTIEERAQGSATFSDLYLADRAAMLGWLNKTYTEDTDVGRVYDGSAWHFKDGASGKQVWVGNPYDVKRDLTLHEVIFGQSGVDTLSGSANADHLYGGAGNDTLSGGAGNDYLEGGLDNDTLKGETGRDTLVGGAGADILEGGTEGDTLYGGIGADTLEGGAGNDWLDGGTGFDTYTLNAGDGFDTVVDSDGLGVINIGGIQVKGSAGLDPTKWKQLNVDTWADTQNNLTYTKSIVNGAPQLLIHKGDNNIVVKGWVEGGLGIGLGAGSKPVTTPPPATVTTITGDLKPLDTDPATPGIQYGYDQLGNVRVENIAEINRADTLYDSIGNDHILGLGGDDTIIAFRGGDGVYEGGTGLDIITHSGSGVALIIGGADSDVLIGGSGADQLFANALQALDIALTQGEIQPGSGTRGDWLSGGDGADTLVGDAGNDILLGGEGEDLLIGGGGNDTEVFYDAANSDWFDTDELTLRKAA